MEWSGEYGAAYAALSAFQCFISAHQSRESGVVMEERAIRRGKKPW